MRRAPGARLLVEPNGAVPDGADAGALEAGLDPALELLGAGLLSGALEGTNSLDATALLDAGALLDATALLDAGALVDAAEPLDVGALGDLESAGELVEPHAARTVVSTTTATAVDRTRPSRRMPSI